VSGSIDVKASPDVEVFIRDLFHEGLFAGLFVLTRLSPQIFEPSGTIFFGDLFKLLKYLNAVVILHVAETDSP